MTMRISAINEIYSDLSVDELKQKLHRSYEPMDTMKFAEFDPKYKEWPEWMRTSLRTTNLNNPSTHYLGKFYQGNFELTSPRIFYWRNVIAYVRHTKTNSKLVVELEYFKLSMIPLFILWIASFLISFGDIHSGLPVFIGSTIVLGLKLIKARNTMSYFKQYTS